MQAGAWTSCRSSLGDRTRGSPRRSCRRVGCPLTEVRQRSFSDGAIEVKLGETVRGKDVFIIQSGHERPNDHVMELLFLVDAARRASARSVTSVLPYFPYGKGDKKDEPRVSIRGRVVADILEAVGVDRVLTMDLHSAQIQGFFHVPVDNLYALPIFIQEVDRLVAGGAIGHPVFVAPDAGATRLAREYWRQLVRHDADLAVGYKVRPSLDEQSEVTSLLGEVSGRDTILVDDVIFTGGTLCNMAEKLVEEGARSVRAFATHGLLTGNAVERFLDSPITELVVTDTVPVAVEKAAALGSHFRVVSAAPLFAAAIRSVYEQTSIGRLFE